MTHFLDGPAIYQTMRIRRAPVFLRITEKNGQFDALDQFGDEAQPGETLHCYVLAERPGSIHIQARGNAGGFYPLAKYRLSEEQPSQEQMRDQAQWEAWVEARPRTEFVLDLLRME